MTNYNYSNLKKIVNPNTGDFYLFIDNGSPLIEIVPNSVLSPLSQQPFTQETKQPPTSLLVKKQLNAIKKTVLEHQNQIQEFKELTHTLSNENISLKKENHQQHQLLRIIKILGGLYLGVQFISLFL